MRDEDAFDVEAVAEWLREHATAYVEDLDGTPTCASSAGAPPT